MLRKLFIHNYVFVENLTIDFVEGFQVITGETGAGKSVILDAFALTLGDRFDKASVLNDAEKCVIEVEFYIQDNPFIKEVLSQLDIDPSMILTIRRELNPTTLRTRSFINDTPATLEQIQQLSVHLVDVHRQFDHLNFFHSFFEIETVDAMIGDPQSVRFYRNTYQQWKEAEKQKAELSAQFAKHEEEQAFLQHVVEDIFKYNLQSGEVEQLEAEQKKLRSSDGLTKSVSQLYHVVYESENAILGALNKLKKDLESFVQMDASVAELHHRLHSNSLDMEDIAKMAFGLSDSFRPDEGRLQQVDERLSLLYSLFKKYNVNSIDALLHYAAEIQGKLDVHAQMQSRIAQLDDQIAHLLKQLDEQATHLTQLRTEVIDKINTQMNVLLPRVGMLSAKWRTQIKPLETYNAFGKDDIAFLVDINDIGMFSPVLKVASGGEFSRIMLCLKNVLAHHTHLSSMVFDEIDVGVSGETAKNIGELLVELGKHKTVVCITHHPTVAAMGTQHLYVYKVKNDHTTSTKLEKLSGQRRIEIIAKMIDGDNPSPTSLLHAKELIGTK